MAMQLRFWSRGGAREYFQRIFDAKFRENPRRYVEQCLVATVSIFIILSLLDAVTQTVLIASLGASSFIAFTMPHVNAAKPRYLFGGYVVGVVCGVSVSLIGMELTNASFVEMVPQSRIAFGAIALGLAMFVMVITDTEHPPAAALALGFVLNEWDVLAVCVVVCGIAGIVALKEAFKSNMIDLL